MRHCEHSEAIQFSRKEQGWIASSQGLLAMTGKQFYFTGYISSQALTMRIGRDIDGMRTPESEHEGDVYFAVIAKPMDKPRNGAAERFRMCVIMARNAAASAEEAARDILREVMGRPGRPNVVGSRVGTKSARMSRRGPFPSAKASC